MGGSTGAMMVVAQRVFVWLFSPSSLQKHNADLIANNGDILREPAGRRVR